MKIASLRTVAGAKPSLRVLRGSLASRAPAPPRGAGLERTRNNERRAGDGAVACDAFGN